MPLRSTRSQMPLTRSLNSIALKGRDHTKYIGDISLKSSSGSHRDEDPLALTMMHCALFILIRPDGPRSFERKNYSLSYRGV